MPVAGYRPAGSHPAVIANCLSLHAKARESKADQIEKVKSCYFPGKAHPGADWCCITLVDTHMNKLLGWKAVAKLL